MAERAINSRIADGMQCGVTEEAMFAEVVKAGVPL